MTFVLRLAVAVAAMDVILLLPTALWLFAGTAIPVTKITRHFHPDIEANFFTWYSSFLLTSAAFSALINYWLEAPSASKSAGWRYTWLGICAVFLLLSIEEVSMIHESVGLEIADQFAGRGGWSDFVGTPGRAWITVYSPMILAVAAWLFYVFHRLSRGHRGFLILTTSGLALWVCSLGPEFVLGGILPGTEARWHAMLGVFLEEGFELFGTSCMLLAFIWHAQDRLPSLLSSPHSQPQTNPPS